MTDLLQVVILTEWVAIIVGTAVFLVAYGRPWRYADRVMSWHLVAVTAVAGLETLGLLVAERSLVPVALVYGLATGVVYWRLVLLLQSRRRDLRARRYAMTEPIPAPTQTQHPGRATLRTAVAGLLALVTLLPYILGAVHVDTTVWGAQALAVSAGVTRVLAIPAVNAWLTDYLPFLAAAPRQP